MRPLAVAITGAIAAGKTELLHAFERRGVPIWSADEAVHRLLREDPQVGTALVDQFGAPVDRALLAELVFADPERLAWLEALLHPRVYAELERWLQELARREPVPALCVAEVPLLYESGGEDRFDRVVVVTAAPEARSARRPQLEARQARLLPEEEKLARADLVYVNDGSLAELDAFAERLLSEL